MRTFLALLFLISSTQAALTVSNRGTNTNNVSATTWAISPSSTIVVGSMGVLCLSFDNSGVNGSTKILSSATITDSVGNIWTRRLDFIYDPGAANAGVELGVYTAPITTQLTTGGTVTVNFSSATQAKTATWSQVTPSAGKFVSYINGAAKCDGCTSGQSSGTPQITTGVLAIGDAVIAMLAAESTATVTQDADTTNGTWSTQQSDNSAGTNRIASQNKVQTTISSTQSYDVTLTSCDWQTGWVQFRELSLARSGFFQIL